MPKLAILEEPRTFPPKKVLLFTWGTTLLIALFGIAATPRIGASLMVWSIVALIAFWQFWVLRWVQVDAEGIRMRNLFQRGRALRWDEITEFREEEVRLSKHPYIVLHLSNEGGDGPTTRINLTNDQVGFETLRTIVREAVPR